MVYVLLYRNIYCLTIWNVGAWFKIKFVEFFFGHDVCNYNITLTNIKHNYIGITIIICYRRTQKWSLYVLCNIIFDFQEVCGNLYLPPQGRI